MVYSFLVGEVTEHQSTRSPGRVPVRTLLKPPIPALYATDDPLRFADQYDQMAKLGSIPEHSYVQPSREHSSQISVYLSAISVHYWTDSSYLMTL